MSSDAPGAVFCGKEAIIFDFDGTVSDSEPALLETLNDLASVIGYQPVTPDQVPELKNMGAREFITQRLGISIWKALRLQRFARAEYHKRAGELRPVPGMKNVLRDLSRRGYRLAIVSSAGEETILNFLKRHGIRSIEVVFSGTTLFGKDRGLRRAARRLRVPIEKCVYVGDEVRDVLACQKINLDVLAVTWGLNSRQALEAAAAKNIIAEPADILRVLGSSEPELVPTPAATV